jgi:hypothetical protein
MKKSILSLTALFVLLISTSASAWDHHRGWGYRGGWVAPVIIGGVIGYELAQPRPYYVPPATVYVQPAPIYVPPQVTIQQPPMGYHWAQVTDPATGQEKMALMPN